MSLAPRAAPARRFVDLLQQLRDSSELHRLRLADQIHAELERMCAPGDDHAEMALVASALEEGALAELHGSDGRPTELVALQTLKALGYPGLALLERSLGDACASPAPQWEGKLRRSLIGALLVLCVPAALVMFSALAALREGRAAIALLGVGALLCIGVPFFYMLLRATPVDRQGGPMTLVVMGTVPALLFALFQGSWSAALLPVTTLLAVHWCLNWQHEEKRGLRGRIRFLR
jgi:hypothetical protein